MGGRGGGPLASWIKEFTTLVFVQTVQAFIFAIIMVLILSTMEPGSADADDYNVAVGLMCVFALTSLFKVEEIIRRIFGLSNTKADHRGAIQSIAKTAFALKLGKRVLDNGKKVAGGIKKIKDARDKDRKINKRLQEDRSDLELRNSRNGNTRRISTTDNVGNTNSSYTGESSTPLLSSVTQSVNEGNVKSDRFKNQDLMKKALNAKKNGDMDGYHKYREMQADVNREVRDVASKPKLLGEESKYMQQAITDKKNGDMDGYYKNRAIQAGINNARKGIMPLDPNNADRNVQGQIDDARRGYVPSNVNGRGSDYVIEGPQDTVRVSAPAPRVDMSGMSDDEVFNSSDIDARTKQRLRAALRTAEDQLKENQKMRTEGIKDIAKGLAETGGAIVVGGMGGVLGGADGNLEEALQGLVSGAGLGDAIGEKVVNATSGTYKFSKNTINAGAKKYQNVSAEVSKIKKAMEEEDKSFNQAIQESIQSIAASRKNQTKELKQNINDLRSYLDEQVKSNKTTTNNSAYRSSVDDT